VLLEQTAHFKLAETTRYCVVHIQHCNILYCENVVLEDLPCKQSEGYPIELAALVLPTQLPPCQPTPVTIPILSFADSFASAAVALVYASSQVLTARLEIVSSDGMAKIISISQNPIAIYATYQKLAKEQLSPTQEGRSCAS
jgi:hypothetical protein